MSPRRLTGRQSTVVRIDHETDRLARDAAKIMECTRGELIASAVGAFVEAHRDDLRSRLQRIESRIDAAQDPHRVDPRTGLSPAQARDLWSAFRD